MATTPASPCSRTPHALRRTEAAPRRGPQGTPGPRGKDEFQTVTLSRKLSPGSAKSLLIPVHGPKIQDLPGRLPVGVGSHNVERLQACWAERGGLGELPSPHLGGGDFAVSSHGGTRDG